MTEKKKFISKVNRLLIKRFGIPDRQNPLPDPLDTLLATILSQNTNDINSYRAYKNLKQKFQDWDQILNVKRSNIERIIKVAGLSKQKSAAIKNVIEELNCRNDLNLRKVKQLESEDAIGYLTQFKGIGVKTASCVLLFSLDRNICPVDTHVHRTVNRLGILSEKTPDKTFHSLNRILPEGIAHSFHTNLIKLGREICKPANPACAFCPVEKICRYDKKNFSGSLGKVRNSFLLLDNV